MKTLFLLALPLYLFSSILAPSALVLKPTVTTVVLEWQDNSDNESGFKIYRDEKFIGMVAKNVTIYEDMYLRSLHEYNYTVRATDGLFVDDKQHQIIDEFVSIFENSTTVIDYAYVEDINDTRGFTAGRAGFTSATGDMLIVIERYSELVPENSLHTYISELQRLEELRYEYNDKVGSSFTGNLVGLPDAWIQCSKDDLFKRIQDKVAYEEYYYPTLQKAHDLGVAYPLSVLSLYDTAIQHGYYGMLDILAQVDATLPIDGGCEEIWLREFNEKRKVILEADEEWAKSVARVDELIELIDGENFTLKPFTMVIERYEETYELGK